MDDDAKPPRLMNPHQVWIEGFRQTEVPREKDASRRWRYELTLGLGEAARPHLQATRITIEAIGASAERMRQTDLIDVLVDAVIEGLARERAGIRPGEQSPAEPPLAALPSRSRAP